MRKASMLLTGSPIYLNEREFHERPKKVNPNSSSGLWNCCSADPDNYLETNAF